MKKSKLFDKNICTSIWEIKNSLIRRGDTALSKKIYPEYQTMVPLNNFVFTFR